MRQKSFSQQSLIEYGSLHVNDLLIINKRRSNYNKLGFAYQLVFIRLFNSLPQALYFEAIEEILIFVSIQLFIPAEIIERYSKNKDKILDHQQAIIEYLGLSKFGDQEQLQVNAFIYKEALRLEAHNLLKIKTIQFLKRQKILSPAEDRLNRMIATQRQKARQDIFDEYSSKSSVELIKKLNDLLEVNGSISQLEFLRKPPCHASSSGVLNLIQKLEYIKNTGVLSIDISGINNNYQKILSREVNSYSVSRLKAMDPSYRHTAMICFLQQAYKDTNDFLAESYIKLLHLSYKKADKAVKSEIIKNEREIKRSLKNYSKMKEIIKDDKISDIELRPILYNVFAEELNRADNLDLLLNGKYNHAFNVMVEKFGYFRRFTPKLIEHLDISLESGITSDILEAIHLLKAMNEEKKRQLPSNTPIRFIPKKLLKFVIRDNKIREFSHKDR